MQKTEFFEQLQNGLFTLGLKPGMVVMVHSSLSAFGQVPGGAETIIEGLLDALTPKGTLLMPALSYQSVTRQAPIFNLRNTSSCVGIIPETFRQRREVYRSMHPTHSVCALGQLAVEITEDHGQDSTPCGSHSPFHLLPQYDGVLLMMGCGLKPNTSMHAIEELAEPPYLFGDPILYTLIDENGQMRQKPYTPHGFHGWQQRYDRIGDLLAEPDLLTGTVAGAVCHMIKTQALWEMALKQYRSNPFYFVDPVTPPRIR